MTEKQFITANDLLIDSYKLAKQVLDSGFKPNFLIALWRGGTPIGIAVQEFLDYHGIKTDHIAIRTSAYYGIDLINKEIKVHGLGYIFNNLKQEDHLLIVDDVYDTGLSMKAVLNELKKSLGDNFPDKIKVATVYYKPKRNKTDNIPDYYVHEVDQWLVFPHELQGLTKEEILKYKGEYFSDLLNN